MSNGSDDNVTELNKGKDNRTPVTKALEGLKKGAREGLENKIKEKVKLALEQKKAYEGTLEEIAALEAEVADVEKMKL